MGQPAAPAAENKRPSILNVEDFICRWTDREGGAERANYQMFLSELCDVIGVVHQKANR